MKVFKEDALFTASTYAAIAPDGLDPCELWQQRGDQGLHDLITAKVPLYKYVMSNVVAQYNLDHADARVSAVREAAKLVTSIRDQSQVDAYINELAFMVGLDPGLVRREVQQAGRRTRKTAPPPEPAITTAPASLPNPNDRLLIAERDVLKMIMQEPGLFDANRAWNNLEEPDFTHGAYRALFRTIANLDPTQDPWPTAVIDHLTHPDLKNLALQLSVEPPLTSLTVHHADEYVAKLKLVKLNNDIAQLKSKMQRTNPTDDDYLPMFQTMVGLEAHRKNLIQASTGES